MHAPKPIPFDYKEDDMPVVDLIVALQASEGRIEELHDTLQTLREASLQEPGCLDYRIAQGSHSANRFFLLERWADADALFRHEHTQHFLDGVERVRACCESMDLQPIAWLLG
ncbi:MAG: putative quinol monooxygenase [Gammaproteobacteria bacterium]|nr:putative quinol monooxygenase [Gammaproteobacteria bacterium]